jgi:hypothetical protein
VTADFLLGLSVAQVHSSREAAAEVTADDGAFECQSFRYDYSRVVNTDR